jgi:hypothetical protein
MIRSMLEHVFGGGGDRISAQAHLKCRLANMAKLYDVSRVELASVTKEVRRFTLAEPALIIRVATSHSKLSLEG